MIIIKSKNFQGKYNIKIDKTDYQKVIDFAPNGWEIKLTTNSNNAYAITRKTLLIDGLKKRKQFYLHRLIMGVINVDDELHVDHINNKPLDNRKANLRLVTRAQNMKNRTSKKNSRCKHLGVSYCKSKVGDNKFRVNIQDQTLKNGNIHLGYYFDEDSAAYAYNFAAKFIHKEYANYNKPNMSKVVNVIGIEEYVNTVLNKYLM